jgi:hypothetical protein
MEYFLSGLVLLIMGWYFPKWSFIRDSGLTAKETRLLIAFKLTTGLIVAGYFNYVFKNITPIVDYVGYNEEGLVQYRLLLHDPDSFFTDFSRAFAEYGPGGLLASEDSFWAYLRFNLLHKLIALLSIVTHGNFYLNTLLFSYFVLIGNFAFFRVYYSMYRKYKWTIVFACFCLPSLVLYTACIHKDGIVFVCIALISYNLYRFFSGSRKLQTKHALAIIGALLIIFLFRNYVIIAILPAMLISIIAVALPFKKRLTVVAVYIVLVALFFLTSLINGPLNLPAAVVQRKMDFATLETGNTGIPMRPLDPAFSSFVKNLPQAMDHYFLRPYLWEFRQASVLLTALEILAYQLIIICFLVYRKKRPLHPFNLFGLAFLLHMALIIGYTIPNIGALVRYRSIYWTLLLCPVLCNIQWNRLTLFRKIKTHEAP